MIILIWRLNLFVSGRLSLSNILFIGDTPSEQVVIVAMDDDSLGAYGRSPLDWSRQVYADLLLTLQEGGARVVAFDVLFAEPSADDEILSNVLEQVRTGDPRLRVVMPVAGAGDVRQPKLPKYRVEFSNALRPVPLLADHVDYLGGVNTFPDVDGTIRRQTSQFIMNSESMLSFSLATYLAYLRIPEEAAQSLVTLDGDMLSVTPQRQLKVDEYGLWLQNFFGEPNATFPVYSLHAILQGNVSPAVFADKIVLVGLIDTQGATDRYLVPSSRGGQQMAGVEIQAHALETLLRNQPLRDQPALSQALMIIAIAIMAALAYSQVRWHYKLGLMAVFLLGMLAIGSLNFILQLEVTNLFHGVLAIMIPAIASIGFDITFERMRREKTEFLLESVISVMDQRMETERILPRIAADVQRIVSVKYGIIRLLQTGQFYQFPASLAHGDAVLSRLHDRVLATHEVAKDAGAIVLPMRWQGRILGTIGVRYPENTHPNALLLLEDLAQQIAPGLENAILYMEAQRQKELLAAIIHSSPMGVAILDGDFQVLQTNRAINYQLERFGVSADLNLFEILPLVGIDELVIVELRRLFARRKGFRQEIRMKDATYNLYVVLLSGYNLWVMVLSDVTALADLNRLKTQMIRMASHDLKNPLSGVLGYSNLLLMDSDQLSQEHTRFVELIRNSGETMLMIINDILNLEQLRSTEMPNERLMLGRLVYDVVSRHEPEMTMKHQHFVLEVQRDLPEMIGRPTQIGQIISNLLGNAVKYTPEYGHITLRLYLRDDVLRLEVQDTGIGISKEAQKKLFTEFYRVKTAETANIPGTGLGLSLVKSVVEAHHGRVWVESEEKAGSTFFVEFPIAETENEAKA